METKIVERRWKAVADCKVAYRQWGTVGKPIVLLHGFPTNSVLWARVGLRLSAQGYRVYAPEMLGLGYTDGPEDYDHSLRGQAQLLSQFVRAVVQDEYVLVGHDLGGGVAQIMMTELSTPIKKAVLTNCVAFDSWPVKSVKSLIGGASRDNCAQLFTSEFTSNFLRKGLSAGLLDTGVITDDLLKDLCQGLVGTKQRVEHFVRYLRAMDNRYTQATSPQLTEFEQETLVVWARDDHFQPISVGERLREILPNPTWKLIEGGHFHPLEGVELVEAILGWDSDH